MDPKATIRIASIFVGTLIALLLVFLGFRLVQNLFTRATDIQPRDVVVSDITENSAKISWASGEDTQSVVEYGTTPTALNFFAPESQKTKAHNVELTLLSPATTYYFQIRTGDQKFDNGGVPWTFTTKNIEGRNLTPPTSTPVPKTQSSTITPVQRLKIDDEANANTNVCQGTDCAKIKAKIGSGCNTNDYFRCLKAK